MYEQLSLFGAPSGRSGTYVQTRGAALTWDELRPGMTVVYDCSTQSREWLMITTVAKIVETPDGLRVILDGRRKRRLTINRMYVDDGRVRLYREGQ